MTMLFSRSFVPLILLFFFRLWDQRREKLSPRELLPLIAADLGYDSEETALLYELFDGA